ncbi:hypothetical protein U3A55_05515 [Salarchaeum sp. III]|uniref:hypothetical protein n=1 Tax=Salarchaeum sp. III TaxID=3107927 RepID=UPI002EDB8296
MGSDMVLSGDNPQEFPSLDEAVEILRTQLDQQDEGSLVFQVRESNLSSEESDGSLIQEVESDSGKKGIRLWKKDGNHLVYEFFEVGTGLRRCVINLDEFTAYSDFFVSLTWSAAEISLYIGPVSDDYEGGLVSESSSEIIAQVRRDKNGRLVILGDSGVEVGYYHVQEAGQDTLMPQSKEIFDFSETKCRTLLRVAEDTDDFLIESTLVQQIIVMLVTGLETYLEERFIEMCSERGVQEEEIANAMASVYGPVSDEALLDRAEKKGIPIQELAREQQINFQDISEAHEIYSRAFGFNLQDCLNNTGNRGLIERSIDARHTIIHEATDMTILNIDRVPPQEPIFASHEYGLEIINTFSETIDELHQDTKS